MGSLDGPGQRLRRYSLQYCVTTTRFYERSWDDRERGVALTQGPPLPKSRPRAQSGLSGGRRRRLAAAAAIAFARPRDHFPRAPAPDRTTPSMLGLRQEDFRLLQRPQGQGHDGPRPADQCAGAAVRRPLRRGAARQDRRVQGAAGRGRDPRRHPERGLRRGARGGQADAGPAPLRRPAGRRHGAAPAAASPRCGPAKARPWSPPLPVYLNALEGKGVHVITVNDYLARRDAEWMGQVYRFLGIERRRDRPRPEPGPAPGSPTGRTSPTAPTTSSASTTCATTWSTTCARWSSAATTSRSSTRSTPS